MRVKFGIGALLWNTFILEGKREKEKGKKNKYFTGIIHSNFNLKTSWTPISQQKTNSFFIFLVDNRLVTLEERRFELKIFLLETPKDANNIPIKNTNSCNKQRFTSPTIQLFGTQTIRTLHNKLLTTNNKRQNAQTNWLITYFIDHIFSCIWVHSCSTNKHFIKLPQRVNALAKTKQSWRFIIISWLSIRIIIFLFSRSSNIKLMQ